MRRSLSFERLIGLATLLATLLVPLVAALFRFHLEKRPLPILALAAAIGILFLVWLSKFELILGRAARTDAANEFLLSVFGLPGSGLKNPHIYPLLRAIYAEPLLRLNQHLGLTEDRQFRFLDILTPTFTGCYAAIYAPLQPGDLLRLAEWDNEPDASAGNRKILAKANGRQDLIRYTLWRTRRGTADSVTSNLDIDVEKGSNFYLRRLENRDGRLLLRVGETEYGNIMRTGDSMIEEVALFGTVLRSLRVSERTALWMLPLRRAILRADGRDRVFHKPGARYPGIGVAALTVLREGQADSPKIGRRSRNVSTYIDALHVIPAGMCNTKNSNWAPSFFEDTIKSEFLEELFDLKEFETVKDVEDWRIRVNLKLSQIIKVARLESRDWQLIPTGLCFDLLNLRPEVCSLILIRDPAFANTYADPANNKLGYRLRPNSEYFGSIYSRNGVGAMEVNDCVQSGACAYHLGREVLMRTRTERDGLLP